MKFFAKFDDVYIGGRVFMDLQIQDIKKSAEVEEKEIRKTRLLGFSRCIYVKELMCQIPDCSMEICRNCPCGQLYYVSSFARNLFNQTAAALFRKIVDHFNQSLSHLVYNKIIGMALSLAGQDKKFNRLLSKGNRVNKLIAIGKIDHFTAYGKETRPTIMLNRDRLVQLPL